MAKKYTVVIEKDEQGWLVSDVVELYGCHTQAKTMDELLVRTKEAIQGYLESEDKNKEIAVEFVGVQQIEI
jgi:predicted RNase H-like HicB family nuclease